MGLLNHSSRRRLSCACGAAMLWVQLAAPSSLADSTPTSPIVVIVGAQVSVRDISLADLRAIYLGELQTWPGGIPIRALNQGVGSTTRGSFDREVLGLESSDVERYWLRRKLRGDGSPPRDVLAAPMVVQLIQSIPGAIGYIRAADLRPGLLALRVDGTELADPGYPLR